MGITQHNTTAKTVQFTNSNFTFTRNHTGTDPIVTHSYHEGIQMAHLLTTQQLILQPIRQPIMNRPLNLLLLLLFTSRLIKMHISLTSALNTNSQVSIVTSDRIRSSPK